MPFTMEDMEEMEGKGVHVLEYESFFMMISMLLGLFWECHQRIPQR